MEYVRPKIPIVMDPAPAPCETSPWDGYLKPQFYIPPVDRNNHNTYVGKVFSLPPENPRLIANSMATNPRCPVTLCDCRDKTNCKCNKNPNPWKQRYFKYTGLWY